MSEDFRSFSAILGARRLHAPPGPAPQGAVSGEAGEVVAAPSADPRVVDLLDGFVVEVTRLIARAAERLEEQAEAMLDDLAKRVLGRELETAPPEVHALVEEAIAAFSIEKPLVLRVAPADAKSFCNKWPVEIDPRLAPGDFAVEVDDGTYDLKFGTRLEAVLAAHRVSL